MSQVAESFGKFMETVFEDLSTLLHEKKDEILAARTKHISELVTKSLVKDIIDVRGIGLTDVELIEIVLPILKHGVSGARWEGLDLRFNALTPLCAQSLAQALNKITGTGKQVKYVLLDNNALCDSGVADLVDGLSCSSLACLEVLSLSSNHVTSRGANALAKVLPHSNIKTLAIGYNPIADDGVEALARALPASSIESLAMPESQATSRGFRALANVVPRTTRLTDLNLAMSPHMSDEGAAAFINSTPQSNLKRLNLAACNLSEKGLRGFILTLKKSDLEYLNLTGNPISNALAIQVRDIIDLKKSRWFKCVQAMLSARQVPRLGKGSAFSLLSKELVREIANALPHWTAPPPTAPMMLINIFVALQEESQSNQRAERHPSPSTT